MKDCSPYSSIYGKKILQYGKNPIIAGEMVSFFIASNFKKKIFPLKFSLRGMLA